MKEQFNAVPPLDDACITAKVRAGRGAVIVVKDDSGESLALTSHQARILHEWIGRALPVSASGDSNG